MRTVLFCGRAGGVGKSQIVVNLARAIVDFGLRVLVLDSNEDGHTCDVVGGAAGFSVLRLEGLDSLLSVEADHGPVYDLVLIDSAGEPSSQSTIDQRFLVLTPSPAAISRNRSLLSSCVSDESWYAVLNRVGEVKWREAIPGEVGRLHRSGRVFMVPYDPNVIISERSRELTLVKYPKTAFSLAILRLATLVGGLNYQPPPKRRRWTFGGGVARALELVRSPIVGGRSRVG